MISSAHIKAHIVIHKWELIICNCKKIQKKEGVLMFCRKCGNEITDMDMYCPHCGEPQNQESAGPQHQSGNLQSGMSQQTGDLILKVFAIICTVLYAISALRRFFGIFGLLSGFRYLGLGAALSNILIFLLTGVSCVLICIALILLAFRHTKENVTGLFLFLGIAGVFRILMGFVSLILSVIRRILWGSYYSLSVSPLMLNIFYAAFTVGGVYLILHLMKESPLVQKSMEEVKQEFSQVFRTVGSAFGSSQDQTQNSSQRQGGQQMNNNYEYQNQAQVKPAYRLKTDRNIFMYILFSLITCGIYSYYFIYTMARDVNEVCAGDGKNTGGLLAFILLSFITCGIYAIYWEYSMGNRLAENAYRYGLQFQENGNSVLMWHLVGILLCGLGPFFAMNILINNTNRLCQAYNQYNGL